MSISNKLKGYLVAGGLVVGGITVIHHMNQPLEYEFSSVYDGNSHHVLVYPEHGGSGYAKRCAEELAGHMMKANLGNFSIQVVDNGEYELIFYNSEKVH